MIKNIAVIGAGTMGYGIALNFAMFGKKVAVYENNVQSRESLRGRMQAALDFLVEADYIPKNKVTETLAHIRVESDLKEAVKNAEYVIEATFEDLNLKQNLFQELDRQCNESTILASNTSSLSLSAMLEKVSESRKAKCMVCHWYNPPHIMPLVELSYFGNMTEPDFNSVYELYQSIEKVPVRVKKDIPGLIANRIQQGVAREVFSLIEMEAASMEDIDKALMFGPAFRYATAGQLEIADMGGLDIWCAVGDNLLKVMDHTTEANPFLRNKVSEGKLGLKSGDGFFQYKEDEKQNLQNAFNNRLIQQLKVSKNYLKEGK